MKATLMAGLVGLMVMVVSSMSSAAPRQLSHLAPGAVADALNGFEDCDGYCGLRPGSYEYAEAQAQLCDTPASWSEQVAPGVWVAVCGGDDDPGKDVTDGTEGTQVNSCSAVAALYWHMSGGQDAAYEDAIAACEAEVK